MMAGFTLRPIEDSDRPQLEQFCMNHWNSLVVVSRMKIHKVTKQPGFLTEVDGRFAGIVTYEIVGDQCEITLLETFAQNIGAGTALIDAVMGPAREAGCKRLWLITTNDNTHAIRFYQRRGFTMAALHVNSIEQARRLKPSIPLIGNDDIPIRDEIELEMAL
jgi:GNAT superfamily N-acetyltransferase